MKKLTKKLIGLISVVALTASIIPVSVSAATKVGAVVGYAKPTDIVATINGYQLESYNVNDYTYICVEDLAYYGFSVNYNNNARALYVSYSGGYIDPQNTNPGFWSIGNNQSKKNILHTDIGTYLNGVYTDSKNINGKTIINFDSLACYGAVSYDDSRRQISLTIEGMNQNVLDLYAKYVHDNQTYSSDWKGIVRAKGDVFIIIATARSYMDSASRAWYINNRISEEKQSARKLLDYMKSEGLGSSIYYEARNSDGSYITSFQLY